jgi:hypothetical protein
MRIRVKDIVSKFHTRRSLKATTIHSMFPLVAVTFGIIGATYIAGGSSYVILTPTPSYVEAGDEVLIKVEAVAHAPVNTVDIEVAFPQGALKPTSIDTGGSVITLWTTEPRIDGSKVTFRGGVFRKGFIGRHTIATIRAKATEEGSADVLVRNSVFLAGDGKGTPLSIDSQSNQKAAINITARGARQGQGNTLSGKVDVVAITDVDGDSDVDLSDIQAFMKAWQQGGKMYDFTGDGKMTFRDFAVLLSDSFFK